MCVNLLINEQISNFNPDFVTKRVFSCKNLHSWTNFYTTAGRESRDKFQVCLYFCSSYLSFDLIYFKVQVSRKQRTRWIRSVLKISQRSSRIFIFITTIHFCLPSPRLNSKDILNSKAQCDSILYFILQQRFPSTFHIKLFVAIRAA